MKNSKKEQIPYALRQSNLPLGTLGTKSGYPFTPLGTSRDPVNIRSQNLYNLLIIGPLTTNTMQEKNKLRM